MSDRMSTMNSGNLRLYALLISIALFAAAVPQQSSAADPFTRKFLTDERGDQRRYSRAVATEGGTIVWLAGQTTVQDADGKPIAGDFEAQADEVFRLIGENLAQIGGSLSDIVTMTIYTCVAAGCNSPPSLPFQGRKIRSRSAIE